MGNENVLPSHFMKETVRYLSSAISLSVQAGWQLFQGAIVGRQHGFLTVAELNSAHYVD